MCLLYISLVRTIFEGAQRRLPHRAHSLTRLNCDYKGPHKTFFNHDKIGPYMICNNTSAVVNLHSTSKNLRRSRDLSLVHKLLLSKDNRGTFQTTLTTPHTFRREINYLLRKKLKNVNHLHLLALMKVGVDFLQAF